MPNGEREPDAAGFIIWYARFLGETCPSGIRYAHFTSAATAGSILDQLGEEFDSRALADLQKNAQELFNRGEVITVFCMGPEEEETQMRALLLPVAVGAGKFGGRQFSHDMEKISDDMGLSIAVMIQFPIVLT